MQLQKEKETIAARLLLSIQESYGVLPRTITNFENEEEENDLSTGNHGEDLTIKKEEKASHAVDVLFNFFDEDNDGDIDGDDICHALKRIGDTILPNDIGEQVKGTITRDGLYDIIFARKERTYLENIALLVLTWFLPLFYSANTRLPFICLALEITITRGGSLGQVGIILGSYQACRALANLVISKFGGKDPLKRMNFLLVLIGLFGWLYLLETTRANTPASMSVWHLMAVCGVGLSENIVNLQTSLIRETRLESPAQIVDPLILSARFRAQYIGVSVGACVAFIGGGLLYTRYGFEAVCWFGMICCLLQLLGTAFFLVCAISSRITNKLTRHGALPIDSNTILRTITYRIRAISIIIKEAQEIGPTIPQLTMDDAIMMAKKDTILTESLKTMYCHIFPDGQNIVLDMDNKKIMKKSKSKKLADSNQTDEHGISGMNYINLGKASECLMHSNGDGKISEEGFISYLAPRVFLDVFGSFRLEAVDVVWPYMKFIVITQAIMALCIGMFLSTSLLYYTVQYSISATRVGLFLSIGEVLGSCIIYASSISCKRKTKPPEQNANNCSRMLSVITSRPLQVPIVCMFLGLTTMCYTIPVFALAVASQIIVSCMNDLSVTFLNEIIATSLPPSKFTYYQGVGQWLRRLGNMITGVFGPILFGISPRLPFLIYGVIVFTWALVLWYSLYLHARQMSENNVKSTNNDEKLKYKHPGPIAAFNRTVEIPWHVIEQEYYVLHHKEKGCECPNYHRV